MEVTFFRNFGIVHEVECSSAVKNVDSFQHVIIRTRVAVVSVGS